MRPTFLLLVAFVSVPASAQTATQSGAPASHMSHASAMADIRTHWKTISGFVIQSAIDVPEEKYSYKPTSDVRSFGELFGHVAGAQSMFCAMALGEKPPSEDAVTAKTRTELIEALKLSNRNCERAYNQTDAAAGGQVDVFGEQRSRLYALMMNVMHDGEHYGNLITYLRMNGMVPPSSRPTK